MKNLLLMSTPYVVFSVILWIFFGIWLIKRISAIIEHFTKTEKCIIEGEIIKIDDFPFSLSTSDITTCYPNNQALVHLYDFIVKDKEQEISINLNYKDYIDVCKNFKNGLLKVKVNCKKYLWSGELKAEEVIFA